MSTTKIAILILVALILASVFVYFITKSNNNDKMAITLQAPPQTDCDNIDSVVSDAMVDLISYNQSLAFIREMFAQDMIIICREVEEYITEAVALFRMLNFESDLLEFLEIFNNMISDRMSNEELVSAFQSYILAYVSNNEDYNFNASTSIELLNDKILTPSVNSNLTINNFDTETLIHTSNFYNPESDYYFKKIESELTILVGIIEDLTIEYFSDRDSFGSCVGSKPLFINMDKRLSDIKRLIDNVKMLSDQVGATKDGIAYSIEEFNKRVNRR